MWVTIAGIGILLLVLGALAYALRGGHHLERCVGAMQAIQAGDLLGMQRSLERLQQAIDATSSEIVAIDVKRRAGRNRFRWSEPDLAADLQQPVRRHAEMDGRQLAVAAHEGEQSLAPQRHA